MTRAEQMAAAIRIAERVLSELTAGEVRQQLGFDEGHGDADVQAVHYYLHTAALTIPEPPPETVE